MHLHVATAEVMYTALGTRLETTQPMPGVNVGEGAARGLEQLH